LLRLRISKLKWRGPNAPSSEAPRSAFHKKHAKPRRVARAWNGLVMKIRGFLMSQPAEAAQIGFVLILVA
jgi:hypothetical protein